MHQFLGGPRGGLMMLVFFLFVVLAGALLFSLMRRRAHLHHGAADGTGTSVKGPGGTSPALQLLDERFARGEIDAEDYKTRRTLLSTSS